MLKKIRNLSKSKKGFTLIELIVVIAILAILAAIAIPRLGGFTQDAKDSSDRSTASAIKSMLQATIESGDIVLLQATTGASPTPGADEDEITITKASGTADFVCESGGTAGASLTFAAKDAPTKALSATELAKLINDKVDADSKINGTSIVLTTTATGGISIKTPAAK